MRDQDSVTGSFVQDAVSEQADQDALKCDCETQVGYWK